jgi:hypothetical protein
MSNLDQLAELREAVQAAADALAAVADKLDATVAPSTSASPAEASTSRREAVAMTLAALGRLEDRGFFALRRKGSIDDLDRNSLDFLLARYLCEAA